MRFSTSRHSDAQTLINGSIAVAPLVEAGAVPAEGLSSALLLHEDSGWSIWAVRGDRATFALSDARASDSAATVIARALTRGSDLPPTAPLTWCMPVVDVGT